MEHLNYDKWLISHWFEMFGLELFLGYVITLLFNLTIYSWFILHQPKLAIISFFPMLIVWLSGFPTVARNGKVAKITN